MLAISCNRRCAGKLPIDNHAMLCFAVLCRAKLFASPTGSGQCLEQHLKPFYSDAHLLASTCQSGYERMAQVINTTRTSNSGKGPSCIQRELKELADKLAQQYHWDRDEVRGRASLLPGALHLDVQHCSAC